MLSEANEGEGDFGVAEDREGDLMGWSSTMPSNPPPNPPPFAPCSPMGVDYGSEAERLRSTGSAVTVSAGLLLRGEARVVSPFIRVGRKIHPSRYSVFYACNLPMVSNAWCVASAILFRLQIHRHSAKGETNTHTIWLKFAAAPTLSPSRSVDVIRTSPGCTISSAMSIVPVLLSLSFLIGLPHCHLAPTNASMTTLLRSDGST